MRLIDADKLYPDCMTKKGTLAISQSQIANAPTVAYPFEKFRTMLCGTCQAYMRIEPERPQGEWGKWVITEIQCPNCLEYFQADCYSMEELQKCPNCEADMRGEKYGR